MTKTPVAGMATGASDSRSWLFPRVEELGFEVSDAPVPEPRYARTRPQLAEVPRSALYPGATADTVAWDIPGDAQSDPGEPGPVSDSYDTIAPEDTLWLALVMAPAEGAEIAELMRATGMSRATLYRHLANLAQTGQAVQVSRRRWRGHHRGPAMSDPRLSHPIVSSHSSRVSARKRANAPAETNGETTVPVPLGRAARTKVARQKKEASPGPPKTKNRPYDNRPGSGGDRAARRAPRDENAVRVILPDEPPRLTPEAARVLLRILLKAHDRLTDTDNHPGGAE